MWRDAEGRLHGGSTYPAPGGSIDGMYLNFGVLAFANEIYDMGRDYDGDGEISEAEQLRYSDEEMDGYAFRAFETYDHPQLGEVEIGGWRKFGHNNPPASELAGEVERNVDFALAQAEHTPLLRVGGVDVEDLGEGELGLGPSRDVVEGALGALGRRRGRQHADRRRTRRTRRRRRTPRFGWRTDSTERFGTSNSACRPSAPA